MDHMPLLGVFNKKVWEIDNKRLHKYREDLMPYDFKLTWIKGKDHVVADCLSRQPLWPNQVDEQYDGTESVTSYRINKMVATTCNTGAADEETV